MKIENAPPQMLPQAEPPENPELRKVAKQFEAVFINQMVGAMRKTVQKGGLVPESAGEKVWQSMLDSQYAENISDAQQIGLSNLIYDHLLRQGGGR